jgi:hypothetical protein
MVGSPALAMDRDHAVAGSDGEQTYTQSPSTHSPYVMAYDSLDVEDRQGYTGQYIFGMTKGVMRSTLVPALKPVAAIFTIPLDLVLLPFAAIAGFFR